MAAETRLHVDSILRVPCWCRQIPRDCHPSACRWLTSSDQPFKAWWLTGCRTLVFLQTTLRQFSTWLQPHLHHSLPWRQGANWPMSIGMSLGEEVLCWCGMAVTGSLEVCVSYLESSGSSCENLEVSEFPAPTLWCHTGGSPAGKMMPFSHAHTK